MATQGQSLSLDQAVQQASKLNQAGRLQDAHALLSQVLKKAPKNAVALQQMSIVLHKAGKTAEAITHIEKAIKIRKHEAAFLSMAGEMHRAMGNLDKAIEYGKKAVKLQPKVPAFLSNLGVAYFDAGDIGSSEKLHLRALEIDARFATSLAHLGVIATTRRQLAKAVQFFEDALIINPNHLEALNNMGAILPELFQPERALNVLGKALALNPKFAKAHSNLGFALLAMSQLEHAKNAFENALILNPDLIEPAQGLGRYYTEKGQFSEGFAIINEALKIAPEDTELLCVLGNLYRGIGDAESAVVAYEQAIHINPTFAGALVSKAELQTELGHIDEAEHTLKQTIAVDDENLYARLTLAGLRKTTPTDSNFKWLSDEASKLTPDTQSKALALHFALGKCHDDLAAYDRAFSHYHMGCAIKRKRTKYDPSMHKQLISDTKNVFSKEFFKSMKGADSHSDSPIFIIGMPRSGTTLVEQIIASHPLVFGAGELSDLSNALKDTIGTNGDFPNALEKSSPEKLSAIGTQYLSGLQKLAPNAKYITDKMPANFKYVGLIHLVLPNAKIIHVNRNPMDTCLSAYSKLFTSGQRYSYDLKELGQYYHDYHDLMIHWKAVLPTGSFYDVQYEDIISDTENQAKMLIEYCGLQWDDACLDFHKLERSVKTASVTQVRKPIYKTSVERWRAYEQHLGPLFEGLGDLAPK